MSGRGENDIVKRIDVARLAGVSEATVSRVFNNVQPLREETKQKVLHAALTLNYQPNVLAKSLATGKSENIGVMIPYFPKVHLLSTHYFSEILSGIGSVLGKNNYHILLMFQQPNEIIDYTQLFHSQKIDGCIILGAKNIPNEHKQIEKLHQLKLPYCIVNQTFSNENFITIDAQHYEGSFKVISHLFESDYDKIAFLNGPQEYSNSVERLKAYEDALHHFGYPLNKRWIFQGNYSRTSGIKIAEKIATILPEINAIFAANDRMAVGVMQGLSKYGYQVGKDYALAGYDDSDITRITDPGLTSVRVPLFEMGQMAAKHILKVLQHGFQDDFHERLPVTLSKRDSTKQLKY